METMKKDPSLEDEAGRDDYLFLTCLPWLSFTSVTHAMHLKPGRNVLAFYGNHSGKGVQVRKKRPPGGAKVGVRRLPRNQAV